MATARKLKAVQPTTPATPGAIRMRAIRDTLGALEDAQPESGHAIDDLMRPHIAEIAENLDVPPLAIWLWRYARIGEPVVTFEMMDQLTAWMEREGVSREDIVGEEE